MNACEIVASYLSAFWELRWDDLVVHLDDRAVYVDPLLAAPVHGKDAICEILVYCHEWGEYNGELVSIFGSDTHVAAELRIRGRVVKPPEGMSETVVGKTFDFVECDVFELNAEKRIVRQTIYADALSLQQQIGEVF
jgi:SnoaL-like domain